MWSFTARRGESLIGKHVLVWGATSASDILNAISLLREREHVDRITLAIHGGGRASAFEGVVDHVINLDGTFDALTLKDTIRLIAVRAQLHLLPCADDYNSYYAVEKGLNRVALFAKSGFISLYHTSTISKIPIPSQIYRGAIASVLALTCALVFLFPTLTPFLLMLIGCSFAFVLAERLFFLYFDRFHHIYYWVMLSFKRDEFPFLSHGWMRPYNEDFLNRLVFSREGPVANRYDIGYDHFPIFNPSRGTGRLCDTFNYVNTHGMDLSRPERSVFILGGSVAQGPINDETSYHVALARTLRRHDSALRVIPWAIGGYTSTHARVLAELSLVERKPLAVINLDFYNDAHYMMMGVPPGDTFRSQRKYLSQFCMKYRALSGLFEYSAIARHLWQKEYTLIMTRHMIRLLDDEKLLSEAISQCVSIYLANVLRTHDLCASAGVRHKVFIQPFRDDANHPETGRLENPKAKIMNRCYEALAEHLERRNDGAGVIVAKPVFDPDDFCDEVHFTPVGQRKMADLMYNATRQWFE
jgi:hypothetical protein